jgi:hypothetical protein
VTIAHASAIRAPCCLAFITVWVEVHLTIMVSIEVQ